MDQSEDNSKVKCPICGMSNRAGTVQCMSCGTVLMKQENGGTKVALPPGTWSKFDEEQTDATDDDVDENVIEEFTSIPGITAEKAKKLYKLGYRHLSDIVQNSLVGEDRKEGMSKVIALRLMIASVKGKRKALAASERDSIECPNCKSSIQYTAKKCDVCGADVEKDILKVDLDEVNESVKDYVDKVVDQISQEKSFKNLPDDMKEIITKDVFDGNVEFSVDSDKMQEPAQEPTGKVPESEPEEKIEIPEPIAETDTAKPEPAARPEKKTDKAKPAQAAKPATPESGQEKKEIKEEPAEDKAKETEKLKTEPVSEEKTKEDKPSPKKANAASEKAKKVFRKKIAEWKSKGLNVNELEELLEKDVDLFKKKSKSLLVKAIREKKAQLRKK